MFENLARELMGHGLTSADIINELELAGADPADAEVIVDTIKRNGAVAINDDYNLLTQEKTKLEQYKNSIAAELKQVSDELKHAVAYGNTYIINVLENSKKHLESRLKELIEVLNHINVDRMQLQKISSISQLWQDKSALENELNSLIQRQRKLKQQLNITRDPQTRQKMVLNIDRLTGDISQINNNINSISDQIVEIQSIDPSPQFTKDPLDLRRWTPVRERTEVKDKFPSTIGNVAVSFFLQDYLNNGSSDKHVEGIISKTQTFLDTYVKTSRSVEDSYIYWEAQKPLKGQRLNNLVSGLQALAINNDLKDCFFINIKQAKDLTDDSSLESLETEMKQTEEEVKVLDDATKKMKQIQQKNKSKKPLM
jgi:hypothetical protein